MVEAGSLPRILELVGREYAGTLAAYHFCPFCPNEIDSKPTMRIFPALDGDFGFRCFQCGMNYDSFELISEHRKELCYEQVSNLMEKKESFSGVTRQMIWSVMIGCDAFATNLTISAECMNILYLKKN